MTGADLTAEDAQKAGEIASYVWGRVKKVRVKHPLSVAVPMLGPLLDMPSEELPGDSQPAAFKGFRISRTFPPRSLRRAERP